MGRLRDDLLGILESRKWNGLLQNEIYILLNYSRSHVSETLSDLEERRIIIRRREGKAAKRIWLVDYYPDFVDGTVRLGMLRSSEYIPFLSCIHQVLEEEGLRLRIRAYNGAPELISDLHHGVLDVALAPTFTHILFSLANKREIIISPVASGGSALLSNTSSEVNELATSEASTMTLISREVIRARRTGISFFEDPALARDRFLLGEFKYMAIWEPYLSDIRERRGIFVVEGGDHGMFQRPCCSAGVSVAFHSANGDLTERIAREYELFLENLGRRDLSFGIGIVSRETGYSKEELVKSLSSYSFISRFEEGMLLHYMIEVGIPVSPGRLRSITL